MPAILEFFPPVMLEIQKELQYHPLLTATLSPHMSLEEKLGHIAAYCNVVIDDYFLEEGLDTLMHLLLNRLKTKSALVVN